MSNSHVSEPGTERTLRSTTRTNPRRRQRQSDNDTLPAKAPKRRRRNKVEDETFHPRASTEHVHTQSQTQPAAEDNTTVMNGHVHPTAEKGSIKGTPTLDGTMTIRGRVKRTMRGDNATVLAQNQCYTVKLLPSTPKELRKEGVEYRGTLGPHNNALAVTHQKALIWEYNAHVAATNPRTFDMPFPSKAGEPLPFGALISNSASVTDNGLLLISAASGSVVFYESIDRAASLGLFQGRKAGVEGSIGNLFSGETVADLVSADHAGFVVVLSSGRLAQLTLRDAQGKAKIWSQFLRATEPNTGGLFGSFSSLWSGGFRKDVTAVHTRPLNVRGQMQAVALTERGEVLVWDLEWSGRANFKASLQFDEVLSNELKQLEAPEIVGKADKLTALDFAILDKSSAEGNEVATLGAEQPLSLAVLVRVGSHDMHTYVLAEIALIKDRVLVGRVTQLSSYQSLGDVRYQAKPRLVLPRPGHTVYIAFEDATILMDARDPVSENPEAQLHDESFIEPDAYEEAIYLRQGKDLAIQSTFEEEAKGSQSSCVAFVKSAGLVRITAADVHTLGEGWKISAKSRIEQGVFYGSLQSDNILDFSRRRPSRFTVDEVAKAAFIVSEEILNAETPFTTFISPSPTSMEQHLATKAKALGALVTFVRQNYPAMSRSTMWQLLWNAERVAIGQQLWIAFEEHVAMSSDKGKRKATLLDEMCSWFEEDKKHNSFVARPELKDEEPVRKFFIAGLYRLEQLLSSVRIYLKSLQDDDNGLAVQVILRLVVQANDVWLKTLETAFIFRSEHCAEYGILPELVDEGVLIDPAEYTDVPEFWTSSITLIDQTTMMTGLSRYFANKYYEDMKDETPEIELFSREIAENNPRLVQLYCLQSQECINWRASRPSQKDQQQAIRLKAEYEHGRYEQCRQLSDVGQSEAGMLLAEKYRDMNTLTDMIIAEDQFLEEELLSAQPMQTKIILNTREELQTKVRRYFDRYGSLWADAFFDKLFSSVHVGKKLENAQERWGPALKEYLRSNPSRAKICWINDVTKENDFAHASKALAQAAEDHESRLWAKKVELSMSKLALMAAQEASGRSQAARLCLGSEINQFEPDKALELVDIQEQLYQHLRSTIAQALDRAAEVELCVQAYANHVADYPALRQLLENDLSMLCDHIVLNVEQLIDILTLMDIKHDTAQTGNLEGSEFLLALKALDTAATVLPTARFETLLKMIWKRCYIYDDWAAEVNLSGKKSDQERKYAIRGTAVWFTMYEIAKSALLSNADTHVRILMPSECLGAGCSPQDLAYRFPNEDLLDPILHDCKIQDELLQSYVADRHLDEIAEECVRDAQAFHTAEAQGTQRMLQRYTEEQYQDEEGPVTNGVESNGHPKGPNGVGKHEEVAYDDVEMA